MGKPKAADTINGYKVVQYRYATPPAAVAKVGAGKRKRQGERPAVAAVRYLYCKMHGANKKKKDTPEKGKGKKEADPKKTLFVLNPPMGSPLALASLLEEVGEVVDIQMKKLEQPGIPASQWPLAGYVEFRKAAAVRAILDRDSQKTLELALPDSAAFGVKRWQAQYEAARPAPDVLQERVDTDLAAFDDVVQREKAQRLAAHGSVDEDGWIQIAQGGKIDPGTGVKAKKKQKDKELQNFYRFQLKAAKQEQVAAMRRKFDLDKLKIKEMRSARKFRPA